MHIRAKNNLGYLVWFRIPDCVYDIPARKLENLLSTSEFKRHFDFEPSIYIFNYRSKVSETIASLKDRKITLIRTGLSWADWMSESGRMLLLWTLEKLSRGGLRILPCLTYTPPHLSRLSQINSPPRNPYDLAKTTADICAQAGRYFSELEFWNEPNLDTDWNKAEDPDYSIFSLMLAPAALIARHYKKRTVLGGITNPFKPKNAALVSKLARNGLLSFMDVLGFHNLRGTWSDTDPPPSLKEQAEKLKLFGTFYVSRTNWEILRKSMIEAAKKDRSSTGKKILEELPSIVPEPTNHAIWLTEYGFPTVDFRQILDQKTLEDIQTAVFANGMQALNEGSIEGLIWYTLRDELFESVRKVTTGMEDVLQYFFGDTRQDGSHKKLATLLTKGGPDAVISYVEKNSLWTLVDKASIERGAMTDYNRDFLSTLY